MYQVQSTKYKVGISLDMNSTQKLSWYFAFLPEVHGTWYLVPSTYVWNLSQVRQGLGGRYWKVDRPRDNVPSTKYEVQSRNSLD